MTKLTMKLRRRARQEEDREKGAETCEQSGRLDSMQLGGCDDACEDEAEAA